jgi:photosystem II stability/assembly factor-like uncharacterized protein
MKKKILTLSFIMGYLIAFGQWEWVNPSPFGWNLYALHFLNESLGFAGGEKGSLYVTTDSGNTWEYIDSGLDQSIDKLYFINPDTGFLKTYEGTIYRSSDGGNSWEAIDVPEEIYNDFDFVNDSTGFICGKNGKLLKSTDAGISWSQLLFNSPYDINALHFIDENNGFAVGDLHHVYKTTNGGLQWEINSTDPMLNLIDVLLGTRQGVITLL